MNIVRCGPECVCKLLKSKCYLRKSEAYGDCWYWGHLEQPMLDRAELTRFCWRH